MELDFTSDAIEHLLVRRMIADKNWMNIVSKTFDKRWFKTKCAGPFIGMLLKYYEKYDKTPDRKTSAMLFDKYIQKYPNAEIDAQDVNAILTDAYSPSQQFDEEVVTANLKEFIRKNMFNYSLVDTIDTLATADAEKNSEKYQAIINKCLDDLDRVQKITFNDTDLGMNYFDKAAMDAHWDFLKNPEAKIRTGWQSVDYYTNGGFLKDGRMLGLFMAQAGLGKSVFLSNLAVNFMKQNLSVVVISLEMSENIYAQRFDAHISQKNINRLNDSETEARERIENFYKTYPNANLIIKEYPPNSVTTKDIQSYLENLKNAGHRVDVIIIDYLNLVAPNRRTDSMFKDGKSVSEELRGLSYIMKAPVISAVQSNSEGMNTEEIDMQNVSESRGICHTVDFLAALYQTADMRNEGGKIGFKVVKNRFGGMVGKSSTFYMDPFTLVVSDRTGDNSDVPDSDSETNKIIKSLQDFDSGLDQI